MIKKFIQRLLGQSGATEAPPAPPTAPAPPVLGTRREIPASQHGIDPALLDDRAVRVVRTLREAGHEAYVVGGAVRDLLVGRRPKDFDVATDATPEQVKALFRRAFIIGRRFRIVHVVFGRGREHEVIEVSTFRALLDTEAAEQVQGNEKTSRSELAGKAHVVDASGRVLRDNVWGPQVEDAARRDFTVNAMYYEPLSQTLVDYHEGLADVRARVLRMIGDPATRYREDPVRVIRAVRFAAKLGFALEPRTQAPIRELAALLGNVPASRLFDEMIKLLQTGHALASLQELRRQGLERGVFAVLDAALVPLEGEAAARRDAFVRLALEDTDRRVAEGRAVAPSFLLACLLWHEVQQRWAAARAQGESTFPALQQAIDAVFDARIGDISGRGRIASDMREIWQMQPRFERRTAATAASLVEQPRFRAGYDFLRLRADVGEVNAELADWWEDYSLGSEEEREALVQEAKSRAGPRRAPARAVERAVERVGERGERGGERGEPAGAPRAGPMAGASSASSASSATSAPSSVSASPASPAGSSPTRLASERAGDAAARADEGLEDEAEEAGPTGDGTAPRKRRRRRRRGGRGTAAATGEPGGGDSGSGSGPGPSGSGGGPGQEGR